jgi:hypothetical protein
MLITATLLLFPAQLFSTVSGGANERISMAASRTTSNFVNVASFPKKKYKLL